MLFIVNPISGKGRKERIISFLKKEGCKIMFTEYAGHAEKIAREADERIIVAVGGDGTVNEVARGILGSEKILGIIPCGSGDGLALHLGISRNYKKAYSTIRQGHMTSIDTATINGKPFFSVCGVGFDAAVSEKFANSGKRGVINYIEQGIKSWLDFAPEKYTVDIDGKVSETEATLITVCNSSQWGNNVRIAPMADISDGLIDIAIIEKVDIIDLPTIALLFVTGKSNYTKKLHSIRGKEIRISRTFSGPVHADGEWFNAGTELEIKINPASLKIIIPKG